jgi:hypothetical protein
VSQATYIQNLPPAECLRLLASQELGRLAVVTDEGARVFPLHYALDADAIAITATWRDPNAIVAIAPPNEVEFEVAHIDPEDGTGWAVVTDGIARLMTDAVDTVSELTPTLPPPSWPDRPETEWLRILLTRIVGVRVVGDPAADRDPYEGQPARPARSDLGDRRLLDEVRLFALTQAHSQHLSTDPT